LFNINCATFGAVAWFIAITTVIYTVLSVIPFLQRDILYATPFSPMVLRVYLGVLYAMLQVFSRIKLYSLSVKIKKHHRGLSGHYRVGVLEGNTKLLEEEASKSSSEIDTEVMERTLLALDEDHALETFFDAIPGFCGSKLV
jgi:hypothetical protein